MDIKTATMQHLIARRDIISVDAIGIFCGYSNSTLHRAFARFKASGKVDMKVDFFKLILIAAWLGLRCRYQLEVEYKETQERIRKGNRRGEFQMVNRPHALLVWRGSTAIKCTNEAEVLAAFE